MRVQRLIPYALVAYGIWFLFWATYKGALVAGAMMAYALGVKTP